ncbi:MAG: nitrous oxide reductase family maturation protein NosD partial [Methanobrevibacter sp. CfCl-M3]
MINPGNNSIQTAIDNASPGDIIELNGGVYYQHDINVNKANLTIKTSGNGGVPIINGQGQGGGFKVTGSGVTIQNLTITNTRVSSDNGGGVYIYGVSGGSVSGGSVSGGDVMILI